MLVYPSRLDAFSLTILESLACAIPAVVYDIPAAKYNFDKCKAVIRVATGDIQKMAQEIIYLIENEDKRRNLSVEAMKYAERFDWGEVAKSERDAYLRVLDWTIGHTRKD